MAQPKNDTPTPSAPKTGKLLSAEKAQAEQQPERADLPTIAGPFKVGNVGHVSVVERAYGDRKVRYARFASGTSRPSMIPLAAVATLAEELD